MFPVCCVALVRAFSSCEISYKRVSVNVDGFSVDCVVGWNFGFIFCWGGVAWSPRRDSKSR